MALLAILAFWATSVLAAPSASRGICQPLANLTFAHPPTTAPGLTAKLIYKGLAEPRGMRFDCKERLLVIERYVGVTRLAYYDDSICRGWEKISVINNTNLEHGIEIGVGPKKSDNQYLYASSMENVFRWEYNPNTGSVVGPPVTLVSGMTNIGAIPPDHVTRTLLLEPDSKHLIVSRGSAGNIDDAAGNVTTGTAQIRRFSLEKIPASGYQWRQGELISWGNRNAVGIAFSKDGKYIWDAENSSDEVFWNGVDVHEDNPADELNKIDLRNSNSIPVSRKFYGYPSCFTAWNSSNVPQNATGPNFTFPTGGQFSVRNQTATQNDAWCGNPKNNVPPVLSFQAHTAPLDIVFYKGGNAKQGLPKAWVEDAFVSFHGSWNRDHPSGYSVVRIPFKKDGSGPVAPSNSKTGYQTIVGAPDTSACPEGCIRPVGTAFDQKGTLYVTSDDSGELFAVSSKQH